MFFFFFLGGGVCILESACPSVCVQNVINSVLLTPTVLLLLYQKFVDNIVHVFEAVQDSFQTSTVCMGQQLSRLEPRKVLLNLYLVCLLWELTIHQQIKK